MLVGLGNVVWEGQSWASNLFAEAVFSMGTKNLNVSSREPSDTHLRLFEAMIQGVLEYEVSAELLTRLNPTSHRCP
jgi:citrate lyase alpha subunit